MGLAAHASLKALAAAAASSSTAASVTVSAFKAGVCAIWLALVAGNEVVQEVLEHLRNCRWCSCYGRCSQSNCSSMIDDALERP
jgi:hypothetical protein